jgi:glyoxylate utilization-related uncharacterized protein
MNDQFGVTLYQAKKIAEYTITEARELAAELIKAANEAERIEQEDRDGAWMSEGASPVGFDFDMDMEAMTPEVAKASVRSKS